MAYIPYKVPRRRESYFGSWSTSLRIVVRLQQAHPFQERRYTLIYVLSDKISDIWFSS